MLKKIHKNKLYPRVKMTVNKPVLLIIQIYKRINDKLNFMSYQKTHSGRFD